MTRRDARSGVSSCGRLSRSIPVTSGFSYNRFHLVHGTRRPHLGVDQRRPAWHAGHGGGGGVEFAGWSGEAGRVVRIRHAGGYKTAYLHFSFARDRGARPNSALIIGGVGQSGTATGPHLDYRILTGNGAYVNPVAELRRMPSAGEPLRADQLPEFTPPSRRDAAAAVERAPEGTAAMELARASSATAERFRSRSCLT